MPLAVVSRVTVHVPLCGVPLARVIGAGVYAVAPGLRQKRVADATAPPSIALTLNVTVLAAVGQ